MPSEATKTEAFTPGPWEVRKDPSHFHTASSVYECGVDFPSVAEVGGSTVVMQEANARLIASAPDLYAACKAALDGFPLGVGAVGCTSDDPDIRANADRCIREARQIMDQIRAALTKATGGAA